MSEIETPKCMYEQELSASLTSTRQELLTTIFRMSALVRAYDGSDDAQQALVFVQNKVRVLTSELTATQNTIEVYIEKPGFLKRLLRAMGVLK